MNRIMVNKDHKSDYLKVSKKIFDVYEERRRYILSGEPLLSRKLQDYQENIDQLNERLKRVMNLYLNTDVTRLTGYEQ